MRRPVDAERVRRFMQELREETDREGRLYFTGGATAVLLGWRRGLVDRDELRRRFFLPPSPSLRSG